MTRRHPCARSREKPHPVKGGAFFAFVFLEIFMNSTGSVNAVAHDGSASTAALNPSAVILFSWEAVG